MKNYHFLLSAAILSLAACTTANKAGSTADSVLTQTTVASVDKTIFAKMHIKDELKAGDSLLLDFTVYNGADTAMKFCKWHTPFEPLMSSYLEIKNENGEEANYSGAMAKRMMPPPADSYITLNPKDSLTAKVNLLKAYRIEKPGKYTVKYTGENMSGIVVRDSVTFTYKP